MCKICSTEPGGLFKGEDIGKDVQELTESIENMNAKSLNYWLCKFVQEVANKSGGRYPSRREDADHVSSVFQGVTFD